MNKHHRAFNFKKQGLLSISLFIFLSLSPAPLISKTINIDGFDDDWAVLNSTEIQSPANYAFVKQGEWIWIDEPNDERRNAKHPGNNDENAATDLTQVRITADTNNFYFYFRFRNLQYGTSFYFSYPVIQVGVQYIRGMRNDFLGQGLQLNVTNLTKLNDTAHWDRLFLIYQNIAVPNLSTSRVDPIQNRVKIFGFTSKQALESTSDGSYAHYVSTFPGDTQPEFMEIQVPFTVFLGGQKADSDFYILGAPTGVKFTIGTFWNKAIFGGMGGDIEPFEENQPELIDCVSITDYPTENKERDNLTYNGTAGTWEEIKDGILNSFFIVKFQEDGNVKPNTIPKQITDGKVDGTINNPETVITARVPIFSWTFNDTDGDKQQGVEIKVAVTTKFTPPELVWYPGPILLNSNRINYGTEFTFRSLEPYSTYYWQQRVMDTFGSWSEWSNILTFFSVPQAVLFDTSKQVELEIDWNNPFNPTKGQVTKIRYRGVNRNYTVQLAIYNLAGELIRTFPEHEIEKDTVYTVIWDGKNTSDELVAPGIYFANIRTLDDIYRTKRILVIR